MIMQSSFNLCCTVIFTTRSSCFCLTHTDEGSCGFRHQAYSPWEANHQTINPNCQKLRPLTGDFTSEPWIHYCIFCFIANLCDKNKKCIFKKSKNKKEDKTIQKNNTMTKVRKEQWKINQILVKKKKTFSKVNALGFSSSGWKQWCRVTSGPLDGASRLESHTAGLKPAWTGRMAGKFACQLQTQQAA